MFQATLQNVVSDCIDMTVPDTSLGDRESSVTWQSE